MPDFVLGTRERTHNKSQSLLSRISQARIQFSPNFPKICLTAKIDLVLLSVVYVKKKIDKINKHVLKWGLLEMESLLMLTVISIYF